MIDHLDRITKLGFDVNLLWNKSIEIVYDLEKDSIPVVDSYMRVLYSVFDMSLEPSFEDIIESCSDFFYMWYNNNIELLRNYELEDGGNFDKLVDSCLGDITKQVYRDFNIDNLLD